MPVDERFAHKKFNWLRPKVERPLVIERREKARARMKERYDFNKAHGICVHCGWREAEAGRVLCAECRLFHNQKRSGDQCGVKSAYARKQKKKK